MMKILTETGTATRTNLTLLDVAEAERSVDLLKSEIDRVRTEKDEETKCLKSENYCLEAIWLLYGTEKGENDTVRS